MYRKIQIIFLIFTIFLSLSAPVFSDVRTENIELFLVLDKSKSMVEEIGDVTSYINRTFIEDFLIPGDRFVMLQFYGRAEVIFDEIISETSRKTIMDKISSIPADGRFTDIGNALDSLNTAVETSGPSDRLRYLILLTDGIQEAPPESPYYSPDGSFNHRFLENTKTIKMKGWKILILGIGSGTAAADLSDELSTTYDEIDFSEDNGPALSEEEILGRVTASDFTADRSGISFTLESYGYRTDRTITIEQVLYQSTDGNFELISEPLDIAVSPGEKKAVTALFDENLTSAVPLSDGTVNFIFKFEGDTPFLPAFFETESIFNSSLKAIDSEAESSNINDADSEISENTGKNSRFGIIILIIILVAAAAVAAVIIRNSLLHRDDNEEEDKPKIRDNN